MDVRVEDIEKVRALIARTASDSEHESDTCARLACQKIRDYGLQLVGPQLNSAAYIGPEVELRALRDRVTHQNIAITRYRAEVEKQKSVIDSLRLTCEAQQKKLDRLSGGSGDGVSAAPKKAATPRKPRATKKDATPPSSGRPPMSRGPGPVATPPSNFRPADFKPSSGYTSPPGFGDTKKIRAKFASKCRGCKADIDEGDEVIWTPGEGVECMSCGGG